MNTIMQTNIKKQLSAKNMTAAELERRTGIPHAVINILHGRSKNPSIRTAQAIAKELGCSVEDLLTETRSSPQAPAQPSNWNAEIYLAAFKAVYECIQTQNLQPSAELVSNCITEVYLYSVGSQEQKVDLRFVQWIVAKAKW